MVSELEQIKQAFIIFQVG